MRKRELQSIPLKLAELKEYDIVRSELLFPRNKGQKEDAPSDQPSPIANVGAKTKKEIMSRLNTTM